MAKKDLTIFEKIKNSKFLRDFYEDLRSQRVIWTWITGGLYVYACIYTLKHVPEAAATVIQVTGAVLSVVFTGYVFSKNTDKKIRVLNGNGESEQ
jgi:hypothetical protein